MSNYRSGDIADWHRLSAERVRRHPVAGHRSGDIANWHRLSAVGADWKPVDGHRPEHAVDGHRLSTHATGPTPIMRLPSFPAGAGKKVLVGIGAGVAALVLAGGVGGALVGSSAGAVAADAADPPAAAPGAPPPLSTPSPTPLPSNRDAPGEAAGVAEPPAAGAAAGVVARVIDGDTVEMADGSRVRLIGIDTPESGECGYQEASDRLASLVAGRTAVLVPGAVDDTDSYGRLLRYVEIDGGDAGEVLLREGLAVPRYNSTDGYGWHPQESAYFQAAAAPVCGVAAPNADPAPLPPTGGGEPWNMPGPDLDCAAIGKKVWISGPDYHRLDADGDGWGCESYG